MIEYRIFTEDLNRDMIESLIVNAGFESFTMFPAVGYWVHFKEASLCISIIAARGDKLRIKALSEAIRHANKQSAVYMISHRVDAEMIAER